MLDHLKPFARFGLPGLALFVLLYLLSPFRWDAAALPAAWSAVIAIVFLLVVASIVILALHRSRRRRAAVTPPHGPAAAADPAPAPTIVTANGDRSVALGSGSNLVVTTGDAKGRDG